MTAIVVPNPALPGAVRGTVVSAGRSFLLGFTANYLFSGMQLAEGLTGGCISVLIVLVTSVTSPIFIRLLGDTFSTRCLRFAATLLICSAATPGIGSMLGMVLPINFFWTAYLRILVGGLAVVGGIVGVALLRPQHHRV